MLDVLSSHNCNNAVVLPCTLVHCLLVHWVPDAAVVDTDLPYPAVAGCQMVQVLPELVVVDMDDSGSDDAGSPHTDSAPLLARLVVYVVVLGLLNLFLTLTTVDSPPPSVHLHCPSGPLDPV